MLAVGITVAISEDCLQTLSPLRRRGLAIASLGPFLFAFVSVFAFAYAIFFQRKSTFCVSEIAIVLSSPYDTLSAVTDSPDASPILMRTTLLSASVMF